MDRGEKEKLSEQLDVLITVAAYFVEPDLPLRERVPVLSALGLNRNQIARVCGTTPEVISVRLAEARRDKKRNIRRRSTKTNEPDDR